MQAGFQKSLKMNKEYCVLRYRSDDGVHKKGDVQYVSQSVLYVGQTPECRLRLPDHPDYEDACYAVIIRNQDGSGWHIVRQEKDASIFVNGVPLKLAAPLGKNDRLSFDNTNLVFNVEAGDVPVNQYVEYKTAGWVRLSVILMFVTLAVIAFALYWGSRSTMTQYKAEVQDICRIETDRLMVLSDVGDTLEVISAPRTFVGTGFITDGGYFVTARHCVEFWLSLEGELKPDIDDIDSDIVRRAIEAETDPSIHLVSVLKITSYDGTQSWQCTSEDFIMDKTRDNLYDYGGFESGYIWRSVVSMYEKRDAELGDVAVMKWEYGDGCIALENGDVIHETGTALCAFGYPQNEERREAVFALDEGNVYQQKETPYECFICTKGFDQGFSGGPVFAKKTKSVVGIVSRSSDSHTLVVPVSQIHRLISEIENR